MSDDFYEEENECIERLHISTKDSSNRFKGKWLTGPIDFSDRIGPRIRTGYNAKYTNSIKCQFGYKRLSIISKNPHTHSSYEWELVGEGEKETPLMRCRRLQCEMQELMSDISAIQSDAKVSKEERESYETVGNVVTNAKKVLDSLRLERVLGKETAPGTAESEVKQLMAQVDEYKKSGGMAAVRFVGGELVQSTRVATLEHRLHELEQAIGAKSEKLSRLTASLGTNTLLDAVQQLSTRAALLQPSQLDLIEARLNNLGTKMDAIAEKSSAASGQDSQRDAKTLELYEIAKRTEPVTQLLPDMLNRMQALESLHSYGASYTERIWGRDKIILIFFFQLRISVR